MSKFFILIFNMSLTGSYIILFVIFVRLLLKKSPKIISYILWSVVAFRLLIPFSFESLFSLLPRNINVAPVPQDIIYQQSPQVNTGIDAVDTIINQSLPVPAIEASVNPLQIYIKIGSYIWILGIIVLIMYSVLSVLKLKNELKYSQLIKQNIYEAKNLKTPFILGLIRPKIYLPLDLIDEEKEYILLHEQTHIKRKDHIIKIFAFLVLSIHWFNPLVWIAFMLMNIDMELSCDERALKEIETDIKKNYANTLLNLATEKHVFNASPLAFSEGNVRRRIKNVLNYKKPKFWVGIISLAVAIVVGVGLFTNPIKAKPLDKNLALELYKNKTEYVGDNSKVGGIISLLTFPENTAYDSFEISTKSEPYVITVNLKTDTKTKNLYSSAQNQKQFQDNALIMFSLIGNVEYIDFNLDDGLLSYSMQYSRESANFGYDKDVYETTRNKKEFSNLINGLSAIEKNIDIKKFVEENLKLILSSPKESSNSQDYIKAHRDEYENLLKYGGEEALEYMLTQFEEKNIEGLRGQIMMRLCQELLGARNNVANDSLSPINWYNALEMKEEVLLSNFEYDGKDKFEKLVYDTEIKMNLYSSKRRGFIVVAPKIFGSYEEENMFKVFVTTNSAYYRLYGNILIQEGGNVIPAAITYQKEENGEYILKRYEQAKDGTMFLPSIRKYCVLPVSEKKIEGLADKILKSYSNNEDIKVLLQDNLSKHLKKNGITDVTLTNNQGEIK